MYRPSKSVGSALAVVSLVLLAVVSAWIGYLSSGPRIAQDYEECAEEAKANTSSNAEHSKQITHCGERFAGRRRSGGGYAYFDFMQNRTFDIAGPNPTDDERKQIDRSYMEFLGAQRQEMLSSDLAKAQADQEQAALESNRPDVGPPLALTPKIPLPVKRPPVGHARPCEEGSLSCSLAKLSAVVKNAFASSAGANR
jgi:hypothetical protein